MSHEHRRARAYALVIPCATFLGFACDPAGDLQNPEYRAYLDNYKQQDHAIVVAALNRLDAQRADFDCSEELEAAQRAIWRESAGEVEVGQTVEGRAFEDCLRAFFQRSGVAQGIVQSTVVSPWVNHNFLPPIRQRIDAEVQAAQKRLASAGCGGDDCDGLTVIDDIAVPRAPAEAPRTWSESRTYCESLDTGGLRPWRLPTKAEIVAMGASNKLATAVESTTYWSGERELTEGGGVLVWTLRFNPAAKGQSNIQPERIPFTRRGRPARSKVRCVFDLAKQTPSRTPVDEMEAALAAAGCPREGWTDSVRLHEGMVVTHSPVEAGTGTVAEACEALDWCGLTWHPPSQGQLEALARSPWFAGDSSRRCVAEVQEP
jgi:hypothetical protein